ncbi:MAG: O-antigen ligase family protein [Candidatus Korobacteraceae bacterium]|jgi:O-antigen ligase
MNGPATVDDYAYPQTVALEPEAATGPSEPQPATRRRGRGAEFYKPFHYLLLAYLFFYCSRVQEMIPNMHTGLLLQPILILGMLMTGTTKSIFRSDIGRIMTAFTIWVAICIPFSVWKGGSYDQFSIALQSLGLLFFMLAFIRTTDDCFRAILAIALAMALVGVLSLTIGGGREGSTRLGLGSGNDTLSDANFLALYLIVGIPFLWFAASMRRGFMKLALIGMLVPVLIGAAKTGSRSALLAMGVGTVFFFIFANGRQKALMLVGGTIVLVCAAFLLPQKILERFTTVLQAKSAASEEAAESAAERKMLLTRSLQLTFEHPLFGVGPGEFMDAEAKEAMAEGKQGVWHYTHNSYTELSSECGLTGFFLYVFAFYRSYKGLTPLRNRYPSPIVRRAALFLQMSVLMSAVGAFFLSIAYGGLLYAMLGLSAAMQLAAAREQRETRALKEQAQVAVA